MSGHFVGQQGVLSGGARPRPRLHSTGGTAEHSTAYIKLPLMSWHGLVFLKEELDCYQPLLQLIVHQVESCVYERKTKKKRGRRKK